MKAERLLAILLRLDTDRRVTARELARALEVSPRTILRDLEALSAAGVPVVAERGAGGGWFLLEPFATDLTGLSADEAQALFLPPPHGILAALGLSESAAVGRAKVNAVLSEAARAHVERMSACVLVDTPGWQQAPEASRHLATIHKALWSGRQVRFTYRRMTGETSVRDLDPYGLVFKNGQWYVLGGSDDTLKTFRVDRMDDVERLDLPSARPRDFDLRARWVEARTAFLEAVPRHRVTVCLHERDLPELTFGVRFCRVETQDPAPDVGPAWWRATLSFDTPGVALSYVLGFGARLRVEAPAALREQVKAAAHDLLRLYGREQGPHDTLAP